MESVNEAIANQALGWHKTTEAVIEDFTKALDKKDETIKRYWRYIQMLRDPDNEGQLVCADCGQELSESELRDNYDDPLCNDCVRALKN